MYLVGGADEAPLGQPTRSDAPRPVHAPMPPYPAEARGGAVVIVEVTVGPAGEVVAADVIRSGGAAFDEASVATARGWRFTPAPAPAYLVFVFREPVVVTPAPRR
jgi:TonB family protein